MTGRRKPSALLASLRVAACSILLLGALASAHAQEPRQMPAAQSSDNDVQTGDVPEPTALEWSLLSPELPVTIDKPVNYKGPSAANGDSANWNRTGKDDGSAAVTVKQSILPFGDAKVGADLNVGSSTPLTSNDLLARKIAGDSQFQQSSGAAWANATAPGVGNVWDKTSFDARLDPTQEQTRIGTSLSKTVPLNSSYAVTVQGSANVIDSAVPMVGATGRPTNTASQYDRSAKLEFKGTGTSLLAGESLSTTDEKWLRRVGAEQKLFGGVSVTGAVTQTADGASSRSVTAGYKYNW